MVFSAVRGVSLKFEGKCSRWRRRCGDEAPGKREHHTASRLRNRNDRWWIAAPQLKLVPSTSSAQVNSFLRWFFDPSMLCPSVNKDIHRLRLKFFVLSCCTLIVLPLLCWCKVYYDVRDSSVTKNEIDPCSDWMSYEQSHSFSCPSKFVFRFICCDVWWLGVTVQICDFLYVSQWVER